MGPHFKSRCHINHYSPCRLVMSEKPKHKDMSASKSRSGEKLKGRSAGQRHTHRQTDIVLPSASAFVFMSVSRSKNTVNSKKSVTRVGYHTFCCIYIAGYFSIFARPNSLVRKRKSLIQLRGRRNRYA